MVVSWRDAFTFCAREYWTPTFIKQWKSLEFEPLKCQNKYVESFIYFGKSTCLVEATRQTEVEGLRCPGRKGIYKCNGFLRHDELEFVRGLWIYCSFFYLKSQKNSLFHFFGYDTYI